VFIISTTYVSAQFPEGFETTVPPAGWTTFAGANGLGTAQNWQVSNISNSGAQSAYCRYENVTGGLAQDWLVTPQFTPTLASNILTFMQRQSYTTDYGSVYKVFISTVSQTTHADFTLVDTQSETDFTYYYTAKEIDLSAYVGVPIYVAFVLEQDNGDNWLIDDVALTAAASCTAPDNLSASNFGLDFATVSWNETGSAVYWRIEYGPDGFSPETGVVQVSLDTSFNLVSLSPSAAYDFYVQAVCAPGDSSAWSGPFSFSTLTAPIVPDYLNDFSSFPGQDWSEGSGSLLTGPAGGGSDWESDFYLNTAGDTSAKVNIYFFNSNNWLISPDFDLSGGSYELNLMAAVTDWNVTTASNMGSDDQVDLLISTDYGINWTSLYQWNVTNTPSNTGTPLPTIDLSLYAGIVRFAVLASDGIVNDPEDYDFYIDDFSVTSIAPPCTNTGIDIVTACDNYTWIDGITYTASNNSATHVVINAAGCDSTVTLDLTIANSNTGTDIITACDSYTWIDGITYTVSNNSATHVLTNAAGCDSTITLDLTLNNSSAATDVITACDNYTWIDGVTYTVSNNSATHVLTNAAGCDSTVTLDLTITNSNTGTDVITACDSYTWIDGIAYTASNNTATQILTNAAGCDSTVTLDLTITNSNTGTDVITACDSYTWIDGIAYTASNNSATHILTNAAGCDSIVTLDLTINTVDNGITQLDDITLQSDVSNAQYQWVDCSNNYQPINGETDQVFIAYANGDYALIVTENNCADTSDCVTINAVGLNNILTDVILNVFPNPTSNSFTISSDILLNSDFKIVDSQGREVLKGSIYGKEKTVNISKFSKGVYLVVFDQQNLPVLPVLKN
jgi:PDZ domain-containing secreted protein